MNDLETALALALEVNRLPVGTGGAADPLAYFAHTLSGDRAAAIWGALCARARSELGPRGGRAWCDRILADVFPEGGA